MRSKLRQQLRRRKRKLEKRIDKRRGFENSRIRCGNVKYELSEKQHGGKPSSEVLRRRINRGPSVKITKSKS